MSMISNTPLTLVNGVSTDTISVNNRGLAYGDGVFETILVVAAKPEFLDQHLQRLNEGCRRLNISYDRGQLCREVELLLKTVKNEYSVLKIIISRAASGRGYGYESGVTADRILSLSNIPLGERQRCLQQQEQGVSVRVCSTRLSVNPATAGIKHLNRLENVLARAEWRDTNIAEGVLLDTSDRLVEGVMSNLFLVVKGKLLTPVLDGCGVAGIIRSLVIHTLADKLALVVSVEELNLDDLYTADEVFICNSLMGICPVTAIDSHFIEVGPVTRSIQQAMVEQVGSNG